MEPINKGHDGASHLVLCREVVCSSEVQNVLTIWKINIWELEECPLEKGYFYYVLFSEGPLSEVHFIKTNSTSAVITTCITTCTIIVIIYIHSVYLFDIFFDYSHLFSLNRIVSCLTASTSLKTRGKL